MHILMIILSAIGIHGMLAATILKDAPEVYQGGKAAYQVYEGYEQAKRSRQHVATRYQTSRARSAAAQPRKQQRHGKVQYASARSVSNSRH